MNLSTTKMNLKIINPIKVPYKIGYKHGQMTFYGKLHRGVDPLIPEGTPLYSPFKGFVSKMFFAKEEGKELMIDTKTDDGNYVQSYFAHLQKYKQGLYIGNTVEQGDLVAYSGNSGTLTTGAHLHWHLVINGFIADPLLYIDDNESFIQKWKGRIIMDVEGKGELYYVDMDGYRHYLDPKNLDTFKGLQKVATGFSKKDIKKIPSLN